MDGKLSYKKSLEIVTCGEVAILYEMKLWKETAQTVKKRKPIKSR